MRGRLNLVDWFYHSVESAGLVPAEGSPSTPHELYAKNLVAPGRPAGSESSGIHRKLTAVACGCFCFLPDKFHLDVLSGGFNRSMQHHPKDLLLKDCVYASKETVETFSRAENGDMEGSAGSRCMRSVAYSTSRIRLFTSFYYLAARLLRQLAGTEHWK